jgi:hypothetical protein
MLRDWLWLYLVYHLCRGCLFRLDEYKLASSGLLRSALLFGKSYISSFEENDLIVSARLLLLKQAGFHLQRLFRF